MTTREFSIKVPQADLDDLERRLAAARWPDEIDGSGWTYGMPVAFVKDLVDFWREKYDWRATEARLNSYPQFTTTIDGQNIHFLHIRSPEADALPLILTHGWPGSIIEYLDVIEPLTNPRAQGGKGGQAYHLVIPSIPGYGFSGPTRERGWDNRRIAKAWAELMRGLGYERYGAVGNDGGSMVNPELARLDGERLVGSHVTQIFSFPSGESGDFVDLSAEEQEGMQVLQTFMATKFGFNQLQSTQPAIAPFALSDSPMGLLAWNAQLFGEGVDKQFILDNVMLYWLTGTVASAARLYYENAHMVPSTEPTTVPTALAMFEGDFISIRRFAERDHKNIVKWNRYAGGGHYAAHLETETLVKDIRAFFTSLKR